MSCFQFQYFWLRLIIAFNIGFVSVFVRNASGDVFRVGSTPGPSVLVPGWHADLLLQEPLCAELTDGGRHAWQDLLHGVIYSDV